MKGYFSTGEQNPAALKLQMQTMNYKEKNYVCSAKQRDDPISKHCHNGMLEPFGDAEVPPLDGDNSTMESGIKPVCRCAKCGQVIDFCTRDNPCPECGSSLFTVSYERVA